MAILHGKQGSLFDKAIYQHCLMINDNVLPFEKHYYSVLKA